MHTHTMSRRLAAITAAAAVTGSLCSALPQTALAAEPVTVYVGDCDGNGRLNAADLTVMKQMLLGISPANRYAFAETAADVNGDGTPGLADAVMLQQYLLRQIDEFPAGVTKTITPQVYPERYYAVEAECENGWVETTNTGFAGEGYWNYNNEIGGFVNWTVSVPAAGNYAVTFRYANAGNDTADTRTCKVYTNGANEAVTVNFPHTGAWTTWEEVTVVLALNAGENTIKAIASGSTGGPNMDYIELEPTDQPAAQPVKEPEPGSYRVENLDRGVVAANTNKDILVT